jgi:PiT family inorganic phosphate transporter
LNVYFVFAIACLSQFFGTLFLGTKVAFGTVNGTLRLDGIAASGEEISKTICAAMVSAVVWNLATWVFRIPSSSSHAIVGALIGAFFASRGIDSINLRGLLLSVLLPLFTSPVVGYGIGFMIYQIGRRGFMNCRLRTRKLFQAVQIVTCVMMNAFQGSNDAQKGMGVLALLTMFTLHRPVLSLPRYAAPLSAALIALGLVLGGMKMIHSVGSTIYPVRLIHSTSAQVSATVVIVSASLFGFPISGTQIVNSAILGVGAADRPNAVGWYYAKNMLLTWLITIPCTFLLSAGLFMIFNLF